MLASKQAPYKAPRPRYKAPRHPDNIKLHPYDVQQHQDTMQQPPYKVQRPPYKALRHPDNIKLHPYDMQPYLDTVQQHPDDVQQPQDTAQQSIQWSDFEETTRRQFITEVVIDLIKRTKLKDASDPELVSFTKHLVKQIQKGLSESSFKDVCSNNVSKAVYSELHSKFGKKLKYMVLLPDPGVLATVVKCFQSQILKKTAKRSHCYCSRKCLLNTISAFIGVTSIGASFPFILIFVGAMII